MNQTKAVLIDGATGTQLQERGMPEGTSTELWAEAHPAAVREVHRAYLASGCDIISAATFCANPAALRAYGAAERTEEINRTLAALARETVGSAALVAGDLSPTGWLCEPLGDRSFEELVACYRRQAAALADMDFFLVETQMSLADARAALLALREVSDKPVLVSMTVGENGKTPFGCDIAAALVTVQEMGAAAFGLNCSFGPSAMAEQIRRIAPYAKIPLAYQPNAGLPQMVDGRAVYDCPPPAFVAEVPAMYAAGVRYFGGCCGTTPAHIAEMRRTLDALPETAFEPAGQDYLASEREVFPIPQGSLPRIPCDDDLEDAEGAFAVELTGEDDLAILIDAMPVLAAPLCLYCADAALLERALRCYQGRAAYAGGGLPPQELQPLQRRYGLYVL